MDITVHIQGLQRQNAELQQEISKLRGELAEVVDEYSLLEHECEQKNGVITALGRTLADVARSSFAAVQGLWKIHSTGGDVVELQKTVMVALMQPENAQRALASAGLTDLAAVAASEDVSDLLLSVQTFSPDSVHRHEKAALTATVGELDADRKQLQAVNDQYEMAISALQRQLEEASAAHLATQHELADVKGQLAGATKLAGSYVDVDGKLYRADDVALLEAELRGLRTELESLTKNVANAASSVAGVSAEDSALLTTIAQENASYLTRATEAEARAEQLASRVSALNVEHDTEIGRLKASQQSLEAANAQLSRTVTNLRNELEIMQEKYVAREGVVDMLHQELADAHTRLTKLQAHKTEMAQKAASALREVEGQVHMLTAAVQSLKSQRGGTPSTPAPGLRGLTPAGHL